MTKPKQPSLFPPAAPRKRAPSRVTAHEKENRETAALILANVPAYGGEGALPVVWARAVAGKGNA